MAFHEVRLPVRLAFGSTGAIERRTEVATLASGWERRSSPWAQGRRRWLIGAALRSLDEAAELAAFFEARSGRLHGFRFRDFADWKSCAPGAATSAADQALGTGDGERTTFQLVKAYGETTRDIRKPVAGSVILAVGGQTLAAAQFAVDPATGEATLAEPPPAGASVTAGFAFDCAVRFDSDRLDLTLEGSDHARVVAVPLVEIPV
jgi:uncharacterized protein (TIGR02217 family)